MTAVAAGVIPASSPIPLRIGSPEEFAVVRRCLARAGYTETAICARDGVDDIFHFKSRADRVIGDALDVLLALFLDAQPVAWSVALAHLEPPELDALVALGLIEERDGGSHIGAPVHLYPTRGLLIVSDLGVTATDTLQGLPVDAVFPAVTPQTRLYLDSLPPAPCGRFLEMCGGTGIAALLAAPLAGHAWSADITQRATTFAEFNARLNALDNVTAVAGDLWAPFTGMTFDRIVAHPPYVAELTPNAAFRDGGPDGEHVTRGLLAGVADHLEPGGRFYCVCVATDREHAPLERRVREMLGRRAGEFDVGIAVVETFNPTEYYCRLAYLGRGTFADAERHHVAFRAMHVERLVYCVMLVQRHDAARAPITFRHAGGRLPLGPALDWMMRWRALRDAPECAGLLLASRARVASDLRLSGVRRLEAGGWVDEDLTLVSSAPFRASGDCPPETAAFLAACDGTRTLAERIEASRAAGVLPAGLSDEAILAVVRALVEVGALEVEAHPLPAPPG